MIRLKGVKKRFGRFEIDVNAEIESREYFVILGPIGAGKTLLLELIAGFHQLDSGSIEIDGKDVTHLPPEERKIGFVYQDLCLFPHLSVRDNIMFGCDDEGKMMEIAEMLEIGDLLDRMPSQISGGQRQKVAIARALASSPKLLLLDEPFSLLDERTRIRMREEIKRVHSELKITTIHVTHDQSEAASISDRIGVMMDGRIVQIGSPQDIFSNPINESVAEFVGVENILDGIVCSRSGEICTVKTGEIEIEVASDCRVGERVRICIRPEDVLLTTYVRGSARNLLPGRIAAIHQHGFVMKVIVDCGIRISSFITKSSLEEMGLNVGDEIYACFKATAPHVIRIG